MDSIINRKVKFDYILSITCLLYCKKYQSWKKKHKIEYIIRTTYLMCVINHFHFKPILFRYLKFFLLFGRLSSKSHFMGCYKTSSWYKKKLTPPPFSIFVPFFLLFVVDSIVDCFSHFERFGRFGHFGNFDRFGRFSHFDQFPRFANLLVLVDLGI